MKIEVLKKSVYGSYLYFPIDELSQTMCLLMKRKTLSDHHLNVLDMRGYEIEIKHPE